MQFSPSQKLNVNNEIGNYNNRTFDNYRTWWLFKIILQQITNHFKVICKLKMCYNKYQKLLQIVTFQSRYLHDKTAKVNAW